jgi:hypothetical protein
VSFNTIIDATTLDGFTVTLDGAAVPGTVELDDTTGQDIIFTPDADLSGGETYTVTVATTVTDEYGGGMPTALTFTFGTN